MPTYGYSCGNCGHKFEHFQSMSDKPLRKCPSCGKRTLKRLIGFGAGIIFKGSGFYQTDYRSESYKRAAEKEKSPASESAGTKGSAAKAKDAAGTKADAAVKGKKKSQ